MDIEAGLERWLTIARDAGRNPETRAHCFASDLALAEEIDAEERLLVEAAPQWSAARFFEEHTTGTRDYTKGSEHYVVRYRAGEKNRVLKATIPGKFGRYEYTPTIYLNSLRLLNEFVPALDIRIHGIRVASDSRPSIVTSMQYIKGRHPHPRQIETYLFGLGWEHFNNPSETLDFDTSNRSRSFETLTHLIGFTKQAPTRWFRCQTPNQKQQALAAASVSTTECSTKKSIDASAPSA